MADNAALAELVGGLDNRWAAATIGSMGASSLELKSGASIMAVGGFTGGDNSPTLTQFQHYVANHEIRPPRLLVRSLGLRLSPRS